jgi:DNA transposition AAA+ family ATPase
MKGQKMTTQLSEVKGPVAIKNVASFMVMTDRLINRDPHLPGIGVCHGPSGFGKTYASIFAQNRTRAVRVEVGDSWTRRTLLQAILRELGEPVKGRMAIADLAERAIAALGDEPGRPLIVDEADRLVDRGMIELVRELHEHSSVPVILIGEEKLPAKLLAYERVHNRVLDWFPAQPCDLDDARELAKAFAPKIAIDDDLLEHIRTQSGGRARRIVVNLARGAELARNRNAKQLTLALWGTAPLYTGEPPQVRHVEPYKRAKAA